MQRRTFLGALIATAAGVLVPANVLEETGRVYSFAKPEPLSSVHLIGGGRILQRWQPGERIGTFTAVNPADAPMVVELRRVSSGLVLQRHWVSPRRGAFIRWGALPDGVVIA